MKAKEVKKRIANIPDDAEIIIAWYEKSDADIDAQIFTDDEKAKLDPAIWEKLTKIFDFESQFYDDIRDAIFVEMEKMKEFEGAKKW